MYLLLTVSTILSLSAAAAPGERACAAEAISNPFDPAPWSTDNWFIIRNIKTSWALQENGYKNVDMLPGFGGRGRWKWASNPCSPGQLYLMSRSSGMILAADGLTLTDELEGNAWTYDKVEKTLKNEAGLYLSDTKKKGQTVRKLKYTSYGAPWLLLQWRLENGYY